MCTACTYTYRDARGKIVQTLGDLIHAAMATGLLAPSPPAWMRLGLPHIDAAMGGAGIQPGTVGILGGGTGSCKSTLAMHMALNSTDQWGVVSLEDNAAQLGLRAVAMAAGIDSRRLLRGTAACLDEIDPALRALWEREFPLFECPLDATQEEALVCARRLAQAGCRVIILDYLTKIRSDPGADRRSDIQRLWAGLQRCAVDEQVAIIAVTQLNRSSQRGEPSLQSPSESSSIEIEARFALMAWVSPDAMRSDTQVISVKLAKNIWGGVGATDRFVRAGANLVHEDDCGYRLSPEEVQDDRSQARRA